jgi:hypothetical protein
MVDLPAACACYLLLTFVPFIDGESVVVGRAAACMPCSARRLPVRALRTARTAFRVLRLFCLTVCVSRVACAACGSC